MPLGSDPVVGTLDGSKPAAAPTTTVAPATTAAPASGTGGYGNDPVVGVMGADGQITTTGPDGSIQQTKPGDQPSLLDTAAGAVKHPLRTLKGAVKSAATSAQKAIFTPTPDEPPLDPLNPFSMMTIPRRVLAKVPGMIAALPGDVAAIPEETGKQLWAAGTELGKDFTPPKTAKDVYNYATDQLGGPLAGFGISKTMLDMLGIPAALFTGPATAVPGRAVNRLTGIRPEITGNIVTMGVPGAEEEQAARGIANVARDADAEQAFRTQYMGSRIHDPVPREERRGSVERMRDAGLEMTPGQMLGGDAVRAEQAKSDGPFGAPHAEAINNSIRSFNRLLYRTILHPIGLDLERWDVGRDALAHVGNQVHAAFEQIKPYLTLPTHDTTLEDMLVPIRNNTAGMETRHIDLLENIINEKILQKIQNPTEIPGDVYKRIESDLTRESARLRNSTGDSAHMLAERIDQLRDAFTERMEQVAEPWVRERLRALNTSWAMLRRVEDASINRAGSFGVASTHDMETIVRRTAAQWENKRAFARGEALMQGLVDDAHRVLGDTVNNSGTQLRHFEQNPVKAAALRAAGRVVAPAQRAIIRARSRPSPLTVPNVYARHTTPTDIMRRLHAPYGSPVIKAGAAQNLTNQLGVPLQPPPMPAPGEQPVDPSQQQQETGAIPQ